VPHNRSGGFLIREKSLYSARIRTPDHPTRSLVTMPAELSWFPLLSQGEEIFTPLKRRDRKSPHSDSYAMDNGGVFIKVKIAEAYI